MRRPTMNESAKKGDTLPMLEHDPRHAFRISRMLRVAVFSVVVSSVFVLALIAIMRFAWDGYLRHVMYKIPVIGGFFGNVEYNPQPLIVVPMIFFVAAVMGFGLWATAEGRVRPARPSRK